MTTENEDLEYFSQLVLALPDWVFSWALVVTISVMPAAMMLVNFVFGSCVFADLVTPETRGGCKRAARHGRLAVTAIVVCLVWQYVTVVVDYSEALSSSPSSPSSSLFLYGYHFLLLLTLTCYMRTMLTRSLAPRMMHFATEQDRIGMRACARCDRGRARPQTHHCGKCGECVEGLDHHCVIVANCIGRRNRRYFVQTLVYTVVMSCVLLVQCGEWAIKETYRFPALVVTIVFLLGSLGLLLWQMVMLATGVGHVDALKLCAEAKKGKGSHVGFFEAVTYCVRHMPRRLSEIKLNVGIVMGYNPVLWFLPIAMS
eukprot:PhM_4_TR9269/c0_g1_i1/m.28449/K20029/ZDHHC3_7_25; palmitoyltransferase ZDHHC3/7/25